MNNKWKKIRRQNLGMIPQDASSNLQAPETAPLRKKDKTVNNRTKPLGLKVSEDFYWQLKEIAFKEKRLMIEVIERAVAEYKNKAKN